MCLCYEETRDMMPGNVDGRVLIADKHKGDSQNAYTAHGSKRYKLRFQDISLLLLINFSKDQLGN